MKKDNLTVSNLIDRATKKKPSFWDKVQKWAIVVGAVSGSILTGGAALPATVVTIATVISSLAGGVAIAAQFTKEDKADDSTEPAK